jgi:hypothetical protein
MIVVQVGVKTELPLHIKNIKMMRISEYTQELNWAQNNSIFLELLQNNSIFLDSIVIKKKNKEKLHHRTFHLKNDSDSDKN